MPQATVTQEPYQRLFDLKQYLSIPGIEPDVAEAIALQLLSTPQPPQSLTNNIHTTLDLTLTADSHTNLFALYDKISSIEPSTTHINAGATTFTGAIGTTTNNDFEPGTFLSPTTLTQISHPESLNKKLRLSLIQILDSRSCSFNKNQIHTTPETTGAYLLTTTPTTHTFDPQEPLSAQFPFSEQLANAVSLNLTNTADESPDAVDSTASATELSDYLTEARDLSQMTITDVFWDNIDLAVSDNISSLSDSTKNSFVYPGKPRYKSTLTSLTFAFTRSRLSTTPTKDDIEQAKALFKQVLEPNNSSSNDFDAEIIKTGTKTSRNRHRKICSIIKELESQNSKGAPLEEIHKLSKAAGLSEEDISQTIENLIKDTTIYRPSQGHYRTT